MDCANCKTATSGAYCPGCGQRTDVGPLAIGQLLRRSLGDLLTVEKPLLRTFLGLLRRPGVVADEYARGRRVRYTNPVKWALVTTALAFFANRVVGAKGAIRFDVSSTENMPDWAQPLFESLASNLAPLFVVLLLPMLAVTMRFCFGRERSVAEELVLVLYAYGCAALLQAAYALVVAIGAPRGLSGLLPLVWTAWAAVRFHPNRSPFASSMRTVLAHLLWVIAIAAVLAVVFLAGSALGVLA